jgi:hypothetical protein
MRGETMSDSRATTKRILVIANETAGEQSLHEVIRSCSQGADAEVLVIASESRLDAGLERLRAAGISARGRVGDADPVQAISDGLDGFAADEIVLATPARRWPRWTTRNLVDRVRSRFAGPIFHVVLEPVPKARPSPARPLPLMPRLSERR